MTLTIIEILYIILIMFSSIIWTLLILVLMRILKILWPITEIVNFYNKIKQIFSAYSAIPDKIKDAIKEKIKK